MISAAENAGNGENFPGDAPGPPTSLAPSALVKPPPNHILRLPPLLAIELHIIGEK